MVHNLRSTENLIVQVQTLLTVLLREGRNLSGPGFLYGYQLGVKLSLRNET